jgi:ribonuclease-3
VFTHPSFAADRADSYERLEFLGDSVLELAVARRLFDRFPDFAEGQMAKIRSHVVSRASCALVAQELGLGELLRANPAAPPGTQIDPLARNRNVLAAMLEAALAAIYLEHGFEKVEPAIVQAFDGLIDFALTNLVDAKTELQEVLARSGRGVSYELLEAVGPPHEKTFTAAVLIDGRKAGVGRGPSKKEAEQIAAQEALARLGSRA